MSQLQGTMWARLLAATVATLALVLGNGSAEATVACAAREEMRRLLIERYNETAKGMNLISPSRIVEIYTSEQGTFSIVVTTSDRNTCVIAVGEAWQDNAQEAASASFQPE